LGFDAVVTVAEMIKTLLKQIREFYGRHVPVVCTPAFRITPASEIELAQFEAKLGEALPAEYREFLLDNDLRHNFSGNFECLDIQAVVRCWQGMQTLLEQGCFDDGRVEYHKENGFGNWEGEYLQAVWWSPKWIPFAEDSCGNMKCLDCLPGRNGHLYQVLDMEVQDGQGPYVSDHASLVVYLQRHLMYLQNGQYTVDEWGIEINA
jgi:cell wall assembly regulator SMI1